MNILRQQLALLLALAMILTMLPMPVHADETDISEAPLERTVAEPTEMLIASEEAAVQAPDNAAAEIEDADTVAGGETASAEVTIQSDTADSGTGTTEDSADNTGDFEESVEADNSGENAVNEEDSNSDSATDPAVDAEETPDSQIPADDGIESKTTESEADISTIAIDSFCNSAVSVVTTDCDHPETEIAWDTNYTVTYTSINDSQHKVIGYQYTYCTSCFTHVGESFVAEELENHSLDSDNSCSLCGYGFGCAHVNTGTSWIWGSTPPTYTQYNDGQHKVSGYQYTYCSDCNEQLNDGIYVEDQLEDHFMYGGICPYCSYSCPHATAENVWDSNYPVTYSQYNSTQHKYQGYQYTYCTYCLERIGDSFAAEKLEDHTPNDNGTCEKCWYSNGCEHSIIWQKGSVYTYGVNDDAQHHAVYRMNPYCTKCEEIVGDWEKSEEVVEDHIFGDNDRCDVCNFRRNCPHENIREEMNTGILPRYRSVSDTQHVMFVYYFDYCQDCSKRVSEDRAVDTSFVNDHVFDDSGVCTYCDYGSTTDSGCAHTNVVGTISSLDPPRYEQCNETQHSVYHTMYDRCLDCNQYISEGFEASTLENHVLDNGKCTYCGYGMGEDYCTHPASDVMWSSAPMTYTSLNEEQHQVEGCQYHYCTSCYKRISSDFEIVEYENHTFDSAGDCTLCDYRAGCAHSETAMKLYNTLYESLDKDSHQVTTLYSRVCANEDCGKVLVSVDTSCTETDVEEHEFDGNICIHCGYTVADLMNVSVTASAQTASKGDRISASASVAGGTGDYQYSWKILFNNSILAGTDMGMDASYDYVASEEGSYIFEVTVKDSDGNTVTAQSGAITVKHACAYETVSSQKLVIQSETHHTVETTTYEECTICHEKRNEVTDVEWVEHTPIDAESYGHEAAHPHQKYFICECGSHPYLDGEYHTANGKVQDESVCCICHGHKYGEEEETPEGTRQKTCANCGITTVTHTHDYKLVETTRLVSQSKMHHTVETTTYEECTSCHEKRNEATNKEWVEHTPMNKDAYGYEASHDNYHQKYFICECGAHPYIDGEYETANGKVQEKSVCCICNGHKYGEAKEAADGTWKKTCANCGLSQKAAAPVQPTEPEEEEEKHVHSYHDIEYIDGTAHPHKYVLKCSCGHEETGEGSYMLCCQCVGHSMGDAIRLPDGSFKEFCSRCNASQLTTPSRGVQNYYDVIDIIINRKDTAAALKEMETGNFALWKEVAVEAADELTGWGFVLTNELVHNFSENASVVGAAKAFNEQYLNPETWDDQIEALWIDLLIQLLQDQEHNQEDDYIEGALKGAEMVHFNASAVLKVYSNSVMEEGKEFRALKARLAELTDDIDIINESIDKYTEAAETAGDQAFHFKNTCEMLADRKAKFQTEVDDLADKTKYDSDSSKDFQMLGYFMDITGILLSATSDTAAYDSYAKTMQDLQASANNITILEQVAETAKVTGNKNLENAAYQLIGNIQSQTMSKLGSVIDLAEAFTKSAATSSLEWFINQSAQGWAEADGGGLSILDTIALVAQGVNAVLGWGPVYDEAQILMTLNKMDGNMNIVNTLKNDDAPYMLELWGLLQAKGCDSAQDFLDKWKAANFLDCEELGIEKNGIPAVNKALEEDRDYYIEELNLPLEKSK